MRNIILASNLLYLAPIRDNSSKHKWFCFLRFKINSSLVWKVQPKPSQKSFAWCFSLGLSPYLPVTSFWVSLINYKHLHSNQDHLGLRQNRADQLNTFQSWSAWFYTTRDTAFWINIKRCMPCHECIHTIVPLYTTYSSPPLLYVHAIGK